MKKKNQPYPVTEKKKTRCHPTKYNDGGGYRESGYRKFRYLLADKDFSFS